MIPRTVLRTTAVLFLAAASRAGAQTDSAARPLSLGDAVRLAVGQSALPEQARLRVDEADARVRQRQADLLPNVSASAARLGRSFNTATLGFAFSGPTGEPFFDPRGEVIGPVNSVDIRARASQTVFDLGAFERVRAARASARATGVDVDVAAEQAATTAALAYVRALRGVAQVDARTADSSLAAELLQIAQDQLSAGVGIALDVTRARSQLAQVRAQLIAARNERDRARLELLRALSLPASTPLVLTDSLAGVLAAAPNETTARAARPDLRSVEAQIAATDEVVRATRLERLPSLAVFGDHGPTQGAGGAYLSTYQYGIQVSLPIFDGFRREGRIEESIAQKRELDVRRRDLERQIEIDVRAAVLDEASAREQVVAARERLDLAEQEVAQARDRFRAGVAGNADVVTASLALTQARTQLVDALAGLQNSRVAVARARGTARDLR